MRPRSGAHITHGNSRSAGILVVGSEENPTVARTKYPKATGKLDRDWEYLTVLYGFPAEHWRHLRTTNPIESSFATVKLRTRVTKGAGSKKAALAMAYKRLDAAQERWRRLNGHELVAEVLDGVRFKDGVRAAEDEPIDDTITKEKVAA